MKQLWVNPEGPLSWPSYGRELRDWTAGPNSHAKKENTASIMSVLLSHLVANVSTRRTRRGSIVELQNGWSRLGTIPTAQKDATTNQTVGRHETKSRLVTGRDFMYFAETTGGYIT